MNILKTYKLTATLTLLLLGTVSLYAQRKTVGTVSLDNSHLSNCNVVDNYTAQMPVGASFTISADKGFIEAFPDRADLYANIYSQPVKKGNYQILNGNSVVQQGTWEGNFSYSLTVSFDVYLSNSLVGNTTQTINAPCKFDSECYGGVAKKIGVLNKEILKGLSTADKITGDPQLSAKVWNAVSFRNIKIVSFNIGNGNDAVCYEQNVKAFKVAKQQEQKQAEEKQKQEELAKQEKQKQEDEKRKQDELAKQQQNTTTNSNTGKTTTTNTQTNPKTTTGNPNYGVDAYNQSQRDMQQQKKIENNFNNNLDAWQRQMNANIDNQKAKEKEKEKEEKKQALLDEEERLRKEK